MPLFAAVKVIYLLEPGYIQTASRVMLTLKKGANSEDSRKLSTESAAISY
jgi:hypothetical protein